MAHFAEAYDTNIEMNAEPWGMTNTPPIVDGSIAPPRDPGWGAQWDEDRFAAIPLQPHDMWEGTVRPSVVEDSCLPTPGGFPEVERAHHHLSLHCNVIGE